jgi:hypothetical protein
MTHGEKRLVAKKFHKKRLNSNRCGVGQFASRNQSGNVWLRFSMGETFPTDWE